MDRRGVLNEQYGLRYQPFEGAGRKMWDVPPAEPKPGDAGYKKPPTQEDIDKWYSIAKTNEEKLKLVTDKLSIAESEKVHLIGKLKAAPVVKKQPTADTPLSEVFNENNFPTTEEDWNDLHDENPAYATELQLRQNQRKNEFVTKVRDTVEDLVKKHPDMYKKDASGGVARDVHGRPIFDSDSPKGKIFDEIAGSDPTILRVATGAQIVMAAVEGRLRGQTDAQVKSELEKKKKEEEDARIKRVAAGQVAGGGGSGNAPEPVAVEVKYNSDEEKAHVQKEISRGVYKNEQEYMKVKNSNVIPYGRGGF